MFINPSDQLCALISTCKAAEAQMLVVKDIRNLAESFLLSMSFYQKLMLGIEDSYSTSSIQVGNHT
jgi:hypothetical protein